MKKTFLSVALMAMALTLLNACGKDADKDVPAVDLSGLVKETITVKGVSFDMVLVTAGTFTMGANSDDDEAIDREKPAHQVTLTSNYYIATTEVTQALYDSVMGNNPSYNKGENLPVESVSYTDAVAFCNKLSEMTGRTFMLPTEAQWEYAARGGQKAPATPTLYSGSNIIDNVAWHLGNSDNHTHPVATKSSNHLGLYDMSGNVWEWVRDSFVGYSADAAIDPCVMDGLRMDRGGSWCTAAWYNRVSNREAHSQEGNDIGFRFIMIP